MSIFFTADLHFNHWTSTDRNIIKFCNRPFSAIEEMDEALINKWNAKVKNGDDIYILGDFALCNANLFIYFMQKLNGNKIFLRGDHDGKNISNNVPHLVNINIEGQPVTLCHWCMRVWAKSHYNAWHLYGHSHGRLEPIGKSWDVGVDKNNYEPLSWEEIKAIMATRPDNPNLVKRV